MDDNTRPEILDQVTRDNEVEYLLYVPASLGYFPGHFPEHPILPGVAQIDWVVALAQPLRLKGGFKGMERIKFMRLIRPDTRLRLHLKTSPERSAVVFRFYDEQGNYSSGQLSFG